jgi:hypothetical protein
LSTALNSISADRLRLKAYLECADVIVDVWRGVYAVDDHNAVADFQSRVERDLGRRLGFTLFDWWEIGV